MKCPKCGSVAQVKPVETYYDEDGRTIYRTMRYLCGCGCEFVTLSLFRNEDGDEHVVRIIGDENSLPY